MSRGADPATELAQHFARYAGRWAQELGADEGCCRLVERAAQAVSVATSAGHVCVHLSDLADTATSAAAWRAALLASGVAGTSDQTEIRPLLLDAGDRLYLRRYYDYECRLAENLVRRAQVNIPLDPDARKTVATRLAELFAGNPAQPDWQKLAAAAAVTGRFAIVSGGPGTGKTHTVAAVLGVLLELDPELRVALAAPTGKAAARMLEALAKGAQRLPAELAARLPTEAYTVHRLLGVTRASGRFRHDAEHPLPYDLIVVDEASMLDVALATRLADAVRPDARLVLLGDKDQLAAVEAGAVFAELCAEPVWPAARWLELADLTGTGAAAPAAGGSGNAALAGKVVFLTESWRFPAHSGIGRLAAALREGDADTAKQAIDAANPAELLWLQDDRSAPLREVEPKLLELMLARYRAYAQSVRETPSDPARLFRAFEMFRVLCAVYAGAQGVDALNTLLERHMRAAIAHAADPGLPSAWYPGRPVLILSNDYGLGLFNGDIGICMPAEAQGLTVQFPRRDGSFAAFAPARLPEHASAWAMSVHKAQGSEFDHACVVLPDPTSPVLTRELVYTAITRARKVLTLAGSEAALSAACQRPTRRASGLRARLHEALHRVAASAPE
ncbi:MAG: exodeoxyribonuclease V subunit alpha [Rhodocyclaceae bacterium]|nr:exodeoxyribonuclease V subunit alpha [Rhodocyclaceae bacterium]